ncbi:MAG TPA: alcohol dehydrogenase catalytic domain-containing protein [Thermoanaerobaculia bacterium]|nr:alcohol dehydrogenase catalytic domain-containing protein [Thermoanaerobaculia bacterium]
MRALWLENQKLRLRDDVPQPARDGEVLVRVLLAGICNTDLELTRGYYPFTGVPGHEFVGVADGKRVVGEINVSCGQCEACRAGRRTHCERRTVLGIANRNGAFAEFLSLPRENLHVVPDNVGDEEAVFTEPLAAALEIREQVRVTPEDRVLVVGHGKLGRLIEQTLALTGCKLTVWGRHGEPRAPNPEPRSFDIVVECSGNPEAFPIARNAVRPRGTLVMKSTYAGNLTLNMSSIVVDEITIVGSRCGPFAPALKLLAEKKIDVRPLIDATYPLGDAIAAFEHAQRPGTLKCIIRP